MSKERVSASVDPEVEQYLSRETVNASGLINKLVKMEMSGASQDREFLKLRRDNINTEINRLESQLETLLDEREAINKQLKKIERQEQSEIEDSLETLKTVPWEEDNPAIRTHAEDNDMTPEELITELEEYHD